MTTTVDFKCKECGEKFDHKIICMVHHVHTKHQEFEVLGTEHVMTIKS